MYEHVMYMVQLPSAKVHRQSVMLQHGSRLLRLCLEDQDLRVLLVCGWPILRALHLMLR